MSPVGLVLCLAFWAWWTPCRARVSVPESAANALASARESTGCPSAFEGRCRCGPAPYAGRVQYVTNCTDAGFQEVHMLRSLPVETQVLLFTGNEVFNLPVNLFGQEARYPHLHTVDLSDNRIQGIRGRTFHTVSSVRTLVLDDNDLYVVSKDHHPRMFSNFEQLEELRLRDAFTDKQAGSSYLSNLADTFRESQLLKLRRLDLGRNRMDSFRDAGDIFCSLPALEDLDLGANGLESLDSLDLSCLPRLSRLDLSGNRLTSLDNASLARLDPVREVNLTGNPFLCDCALHDALLWLRGRGRADRSDPVCRGPEGREGRPLTSLREDELPCPAAPSPLGGQRHDLPGGGHPAASYAVLALVGLALTALLVLVLVRNRSQVAVLVATCTAPLRNKLHYSSLDKRDEAEMEV